jgi:CheY-like chemotaxis protein
MRTKTSECSRNEAREPRRPCALIVEHDAAIRHTLECAFDPELEVYAAKTAAEAAVLLEQLECVDIALVDFELLDEGGECILERLSRWPDSIRILISGQRPADESTLCNRALVNLVLRKPVAPPAVEALKRATLDLSAA